MQTRLLSAAAFAALTLLAACGGGDAAENAGSAAADSAARGDTAPAAMGQAPAAASSADVMAKAPAQIRGIYLNAYAAGSSRRLAALIKIADETEINAFVVDWKDEKGPHYASEVPLAKQMTTPTEVTLRNPKAFTDSLRAHGIYSIARIVVFKDPVLSKAQPDWSTRQAGGGLWVDKAGNTWVSPWDERVWDYNIAIAEEAVRAGFDMIQFDYVRFPEPYKSLPPQVHPRAKGERTDAIAAFLNRAKERLHPLGVPVTADVFGLTPNTPDDLDIGQQWETISATADASLPMVYPSHYFPTHLKGVPRPNRMPYETVYQSVGMGVVRSQRLREAGVRPARIMPWLQAFSAPWVEKNYPYGPEQAAAQIKAVHDLGLEDWIFWHPGSRYEQVAAAFARGETTSKAKPYTPPEVVTSAVATMERQGILEARQRAAEQARGRTTDPAGAAAARQGRPEPDPAPAAAEPGKTAPAEATPPARP
jgi:hypothetical protein